MTVIDMEGSMLTGPDHTRDIEATVTLPVIEGRDLKYVRDQYELAEGK